MMKLNFFIIFKSILKPKKVILCIFPPKKY